MWSIGVEVEQQTSAPPPKKNPGSARAKIGRKLGIHQPGPEKQYSYINNNNNKLYLRDYNKGQYCKSYLNLIIDSFLD